MCVIRLWDSGPGREPLTSLSRRVQSSPTCPSVRPSVSPSTPASNHRAAILINPSSNEDAIQLLNHAAGIAVLHCASIPAPHARAASVSRRSACMALNDCRVRIVQVATSSPRYNKARLRTPDSRVSTGGGASSRVEYWKPRVRTRDYYSSAAQQT